MRFPILGQAFILACLYHAQVTLAQDCNNGGNNPYTRVLLAKYDGPSTYDAIPLTFEEALGNCYKLDDFAEGMYKHYESLGFNMTSARRSSIHSYEDSNIMLSSSVKHSDSAYRIPLETFYEYARSKNAPIIFASWGLIPKVDHYGPRGRFPRNHWGVYGVLRFKLHGREFCVNYRDASPMSSYRATGASTVHFSVSNKYLGDGTARGILVNNGTFTSGSYIMTFPA